MSRTLALAVGALLVIAGCADAPIAPNPNAVSPSEESEGPDLSKAVGPISYEGIPAGDLSADAQVNLQSSATDAVVKAVQTDDRREAVANVDALLEAGADQNPYLTRVAATMLIEAHLLTSDGAAVLPDLERYVRLAVADGNPDLAIISASLGRLESALSSEERSRLAGSAIANSEAARECENCDAPLPLEMPAPVRAAFEADELAQTAALEEMQALRTAD